MQREEKRGMKYDGIILDPPKFGRGPKGEVWEVYKSLPNLFEICRACLSDNPLFVIATLYAVRASAIHVAQVLDDMMKKYRVEYRTAENWSHAKQARTGYSHRLFMRDGLPNNKTSEFLPTGRFAKNSEVFMNLSAAATCATATPHPLLLLLLVLVAGDVIFFNKSYQKDAPCETAAAVNPRPSTFKITNNVHSPAVAPAAGRSVCHQPTLWINLQAP